MRVWRICTKRRQSSAFTGIGAAENPGRWNSAGRKAVYCAESRALAACEILVHVENKRRLRFAKFVVIPVDIPDALIGKVTGMPSKWDKIPHGTATQLFGDKLLESSDYPVHQLPSAVVKGESCFLLNPEHSNFHLIKIGAAEEFRFDDRIIA